MTEAEFWGSTPRWFSARRAAWIRREQSEWERVRMLAYYTVKTVDTKNRVKSPQGLMTFPWETAQKRKTADRPPTQVELEAFEKFSREADEWYYSQHPEHRPQENGSSQ